MPSSLDNAVDHLAAAEIANPYQPPKPAKPLPPTRPFLVALLVAIGGWSASLAWMASLASDLSAIVAPIAVGGGALLASVLLFLLAAHLSLRASAVLRHEAETARNLAAREMTRQKVYQEKLDQLGSSHDTMYALLFKSRRLSNARVLEEDYVVRDYLLSAPDARVVSVDAIGDPQRIFGEALEDGVRRDRCDTRGLLDTRPRIRAALLCVDVRQAFPELSLCGAPRDGVGGGTRTSPPASRPRLSIVGRSEPSLPYTGLRASASTARWDFRLAWMTTGLRAPRPTPGRIATSRRSGRTFTTSRIGRCFRSYSSTRDV